MSRNCRVEERPPRTSGGFFQHLARAQAITKAHGELAMQSKHYRLLAVGWSIFILVGSTLLVGGLALSGELSWAPTWFVATVIAVPWLAAIGTFVWNRLLR